MENQNKRLDWIEALKAFAIIGILWNHIIESRGSMPWFSSPSENWLPLQERVQHVLPDGENLLIVILKFIGWLGDMGPGVFILVSGFTLTLSSLNKNKNLNVVQFYKKRLTRILPLYMVVHLFFIILLILRGETWALSSEKILLSFLGLRWNDSLFYFINPSWWFIWLILQLYLLFPYLFKMLKRHGGAFLIITLLFTIISRLIGVTGLYYNNSMSNWMTGLFFGTRLFEFSLGMFLAYLYNEKHILYRWNHATILVMGFVIYIVGFMLSLTYLGSLVSNILITLGLSIIFITIYQFLRNMPSIKKTIFFIGISSFPAFLIHQPFMIWLSGENENITGLPYLLILIAVISIPVGYLIERFVNNTINLLRMKIQSFSRIRVIEFILMVIFILHFLINLAISFLNHEQVNKVFTLYSIGIFLLFPLILLTSECFHRKFKSFIVIYLFLTFLFQVLPGHWIGIFWITILASVIIMFLTSYSVNSWILISMISLFVTGILFSGIEIYLRIHQPIEAKRWGEYSALQQDSLTIYSLKSNKTTRLKYNNYDYLLKTNSIGFNSPSIPLEKKPNEIRVFIMGDAFTMPEGFEYTKAYPYILETMLRENFPGKKINVINAGVTGYGPNEWEEQLRKYVSLVKPDFIVNQFFVNEYEEIHYSKIFRLKNIGLDKGFSLKRELFFHAQIPAWYKKLLTPVVPSREKAYNYYKSHVFLYDKERAEYYYSDSAISKMKHYLSTIKQLSDSAGAKITILYVPGQITVSRINEIDYYPDHLNFNDSTRFDKLLPYKVTSKLCEETEIQVINLQQAFDTSENGPFYFSESWHWTQAGHEIAARGLYNYLITDTMFMP